MHMLRDLRGTSRVKATLKLGLFDPPGNAAPKPTVEANLVLLVEEGPPIGDLSVH